jgi:5-(carboxyamino)imidazole ribonucleotide synthase
VSPAADSVAVAQDRIREKRFLAGIGLGTAPFTVIEHEGDIDAVDAALLPGILKRARFGYDGKGQVGVGSLDDIRAAFWALGAEACVLEQRLDLDLEVSCVVARGFDGEVRAFPVAENAHAGGILDVSIVPARISPVLADRVRDATVRVAEALDYRGVLCVEYFVVGGEDLLANEIAPRPHNSGHYTVDGCVTSQFEQQARVMCGLPLGDTAAHCPSVMVNLLGELWDAGEPDWTHVLSHPRAKLHLYGKETPRLGRKMGHFTVLDDDLSRAIATAGSIKSRLDADACREPESGES